MFVLTSRIFGVGRCTAPVLMGSRLKVKLCEYAGGRRKWKSLRPQKRKASFSEKERRSAWLRLGLGLILT